ncbi:hypothetical protein THRCLA_05176 [Thraustotheca clavata]|uniref:Macro domain-containing protein n=1 Tax=Thraustotheca clavata TaxID=74557 RepID=A0A1V9ZWQ7_9STRA|nr:hypothetical protein THRCLA_05176 [Thraustotheca clavata]
MAKKLKVNASCLEITEVCKTILSMCTLEAAERLSIVVLSTVGTRKVAEDKELWQLLIEAHYGNQRNFFPAAPCPKDILPMPYLKPSDMFYPSAACIEFCETLVERRMFDRLKVEQGDIQTYSIVDEQPIDCIIFPTNSSLINAGTGAAAAVFRRSGMELDTYVRELHYDGRESNTVVTPGFEAGVDHLIHCVGPSHLRMNCNPLLYQTYLNAFEQARKLGVKCVAVASIATGTLGFPLHTAAALAMRAYRDFIKTHRWTATVVFVCYDNRIATFIEDAKQQILDRFNDHCFQVMAVI